MEKIGISWAVCCLVLFSSSLVSTTHWVLTDNSHVVKRQAPVSIYGQRAAQSFGQAQQICRVCSMCYLTICCKDYLCVYQPPPNYATTSTRPYNYGTYSTNLNPVYTTERTTTTARIPLTSHSKDTIVPSVPPNIANRDNFDQSTPKVHLQNTPNLGMASIDYTKFYNTTTGISLDRVLPERKYSFAIPSSDH